MEFNDQQLMQQITQGSQEALKSLYTCYYDRVYTFLFYRLDRNTGWTEEIVQDVFLNVWYSARNYHGEAKPITWILQIARNLSARSRRDRNRRAEGYLVEFPPLLAEANRQEEFLEKLVGNFANSLENDVVNRLAFAEALWCLPLKYREVLVLVCHQGFLLSEVAQILGLPVGTIKSRLNKARCLLLASLRQTEVLEGKSYEK